MSDESDEQFNELARLSSYTVTAKYPERDSGFNLINILSSSIKDEGFPVDEDDVDEDGTDGASASVLQHCLSLLIFIYLLLIE